MRAYVIAVAAVAISALLRLLLDPIFVAESPLLAFVVGVVVASMHGGLWPGLLATLLSIVAGDYLFIEPRMTFGVWSTLDVTRVTLFALEGVVIAYLSEQRRKNLEANRQLTEQVRRHNERLDAEVQRRTAELQKSNEALETFAHTISHDLTAPLRSIRGFAEIIREDFDAHLSAAAREYTDRIAAAAQRLEALIHNLLAYTKLGHQGVAFEAVSLERIARQVVHDMAEEIRRTGGHVAVDSDLGSVLAHRDTLGLIFTNLVSNALKFVPQGRAPRVRISAVRRGDRIRVSVVDNGIGIAADDRRRVFQPFERLSTGEPYAGSGLGLALVSRSVERMNGSCGVESWEGGSDFWFELAAAVREVE